MLTCAHADADLLDMEGNPKERLHRRSGFEDYPNEHQTSTGEPFFTIAQLAEIIALSQVCAMEDESQRAVIIALAEAQLHFQTAQEGCEGDVLQKPGLTRSSSRSGPHMLEPGQAHESFRMDSGETDVPSVDDEDAFVAFDVFQVGVEPSAGLLGDEVNVSQFRRCRV